VRTSPGFKRVRSGACRGGDASSPSLPGANTHFSAAGENLALGADDVDVNGVCGVSDHWSVVACVKCFCESADQSKRLLGQLIIFARRYALEAADRVLERNDLTIRPVKTWDVERL